MLTNIPSVRPFLFSRRPIYLPEQIRNHRAIPANIRLNAVIVNRDRGREGGTSTFRDFSKRRSERRSAALEQLVIHQYYRRRNLVVIRQ